MNCGCEVLSEVSMRYCDMHKAAPEMYEALKLVQAEDWNLYDRTAEAVERALAKAEGR